MTPLVLSLFPGIGLLDRAFEEEGFCVVRGPDLLWGGDVRRFHPPAGRFEGVIGGPPCQMFSALRSLNQAQGKMPRYGNLIPEYERCVEEASPAWYLMENVPAAPVPQPRGYWPARTALLDCRWVGGEQHRRRRFSFGMRFDGEARTLDVSDDLVVLEPPRVYAAVVSGNGFGSGSAYYRERNRAVTAAHGGGHKRNAMVRYSPEEAARLQGLPEDFLAAAPFTKGGRLQAIANGVPLPMGRAVARAVKRAMGYALEEVAS